MDNFWAQLNDPLLMIAGRDITTAQLVFIPLLILVGWLLARSISRSIHQRATAKALNPDIAQLLIRVVYIAVFTTLTLLVLGLLNVPLTALAFVSGAVAIGVGFGAQNIINNFISGWILLWERPIKIGDFVEMGDTRGTVEAINTRSTRVRRVDGVHLLIPNSSLLENTVVNWTLIDRVTRTTVRVGVAYGSDTRLVQRLVMEAITTNPDILADPKPSVMFEDFGDNALIFDAYIWIEATADRDLRTVRSELRFAIEAAFREHDITIAFPQRDVHLDGVITLQQ